MEKELLDLLCLYSEDGKLADEDFIRRAVEILIKYNNLNDEVENIVFSTTKEFIAEYCDEEKTIYVYLNSFSKHFSIIDEYRNCLSQREVLYAKNIFVLKTIFHEIEHAKQLKYVHSLDSKQLKNRIDILSISIYPKQVLRTYKVSKQESARMLNNIINKYDSSYYYNPDERMAEIMAYVYLFKVIKPIAKDIEKEYALEIIEFINTQLSGYTFRKGKPYSCPTLRYIDEFYKGYSESIVSDLKIYRKGLSKNLKFSRKYNSLDARLLYGLPISREEYQKKRRIRSNMIDKLVEK